MKKYMAIMCVISLIALINTGCNKKEDRSIADDSNYSTTENKQSENDINSETTLEVTDIETTEKRNIVNPVKVNISADTKSSAEIYESISDINLNRPDVLRPGEVFLGWKENDVVKQIMGKTVDISSTIEMTVESKDISDDSNVIYNDSIYVCNDIPTSFSANISIGGNVDFSILEMEKEYDSNLMEFVEFQNIDPDLTCNCISKENKIYLSFSSVSRINGELDILDIVFRTKGNTAAETSLKYKIKDMAAWDESISDFYNVRHSVVDGKIVMY